MLPLLRIDDFAARPYGVRHNLLDLAEYMRPEINIEMRRCLIEMMLIFLKGHLVAKFKASIIIRPLLYCIVCQMDELIEILQVEFSTRRSQIAIIIDKTLEAAIDRCYGGKTANIKLSILV